VGPAMGGPWQSEVEMFATVGPHEDVSPMSNLE